MLPLTNYVVERLKQVLKSDGMQEVDINFQFSNVNSILITQLPAVCLLSTNRPASCSSHQSHIHFTGESMDFFYPRNSIQYVNTDLSRDIRQLVTLSKSNITSLYSYVNMTPPTLLNIVNGDLISSFTLKKLGHNFSQVQLSKLRGDDQSFLALRGALYENDILVFVKKNDEQDYFVFGIKNLTYLTLQLQLGYYYTITSPTLSDTVIYETIEPQFSQVREVTSNQIAQFNTSDTEQFLTMSDPSNGIMLRRERTQRHQSIVRLLAQCLSVHQYRLFEDPIDCLATKLNAPTLIFEIKTLDGTPADERSQVMKAFSQLCYYEYFYVNNYSGPYHKVAVFETKISDSHIAFLNSYNINVAWLDNQNQFTFSTPISF